MDFGEKLQILRKRNGLSQEDLAVKLNVSRQAISKWEVGSVPDLVNIKKISRYFGCTIDSLVFDELELDQQEPTQGNNTYSFRCPKLPPETLCLIISALTLCVILALWIGSRCLDRETILQYIGHKYLYARFLGFLRYYDLYHLFYFCIGSSIVAISVRIYIQLFVRNRKNNIKYVYYSLVPYLLYLISTAICVADVAYNLFLFVQIPALHLLMIVNAVISMACIVIMWKTEKEKDCSPN